MAQVVGILLALWLGAAPQNTGVLQGALKRVGTSEPIADVDLTLTLMSSATMPRPSVRTQSDPQGRFLFNSLPAGRYMLRASKEGHLTVPGGVELPSEVATFTLDAGATRTLTIDLAPGATIAGTIRDPDGRPLSGVTVTFAKLQYEQGRRTFGLGSLPKQTNDRGEYRLLWIPPGEYFIRVEYPNAPGNLARRSYFPGTVDAGAAVPLTIRGGEILEGMNIVIPVAGNIKISGKVVADELGPGAGYMQKFYLLPQDGRPTEVNPPEFTNTILPQLGQQTADFQLEVRGLAPGLYDLASFFLDFGNTFHTGRTRIQITDRDLEDVSVRISSNVDVVGRVTVTGVENFRQWGSLHLQLRAKDVAVPLTGRSSLATFNNADGTFSIRSVIEGRYQLYVGAYLGSIPTGLYISALRQGAVDLRNEGTLDVRPGMQPIEITLSAGAGKVRGTVEAAGGRVPPFAEVVLVPEFARRQNLMFYDRTIINEKGEFTFEGIAPGDYKIFAFEQLEDGAEQNPSFIAAYETLGQGIRIEPGAELDARVRLLR